MIEYIILSSIKILDNIIITAKSIATYKGQKILSSVLVMLSQLIFYFIISKVISDNTILAIIIVSVSSGIGNYIAFMLNDRFKKDSKWTMVITMSNFDDMKSLCNYLKENKIRYIANNGYDRKWNDTLHVIAFSKTKSESRLIDKYLATSSRKYLKEVI